jgi:serine phosphatase RsbU (regulator of sigma subunit)
MADSTEKIASGSDEATDLRRALEEERRHTALFTESLIPIGLALLRETDLTKLLEMILREAQRLSAADGATLYMRRGDQLEFFMVLNYSLGLAMGGSSGHAITFPPLLLNRSEDGKPNLGSAACYSVLKRRTLNLENIYEHENFDFSGSRRFDDYYGYHTTSLLTVPLTGADGEPVAVLQMINALDPETHAAVPFSPSIQRVVESLAALAAGALESFGVKERLYQQQQLYLRNLETTQARLREELDEAEKYVRAILPPFCDGPLKIDWLLAPCSELGGDSFGYHELDTDHWALYVLDVCGHGLSAALLSVTANKVLQFDALPNVDFRDPGAVLTALNDEFLMCHQNNMYFTIWYGVYRLSTRELRFASAGHAPALRVDPVRQTAAKLTAPGLVLGARAGKIYTAQSTVLPPGAVLYLLSDGTYEIHLPDGTMWPFAEFLRLLVSLPPGDPGALGQLHAAISRLRAPERLEDDFSIVRILT